MRGHANGAALDAEQPARARRGGIGGDAGERGRDAVDIARIAAAGVGDAGAVAVDRVARRSDIAGDDELPAARYSGSFSVVRQRPSASGVCVHVTASRAASASGTCS